MDLLKIGFVTVTFIDLIDIAVVAFIIYYLYQAIRGTQASQIFFGLVLVLLISYGAQILNLRALSLILKLFTDVWIIFFVVVFQPDIRHLLMKVTNKIFRTRFKTDSPESVTEIIDAAFALSQSQHGALIVVSKSNKTFSFEETGVFINSKVNKSLICSIFFPRSPLHDGAILIRQDVIVRAKCTLPNQSQTGFTEQGFGMRHKAGIVTSEMHEDLIAIIVSEETGSISIAEKGILRKGISREEMYSTLIDIYGVNSANVITGN